MSRTALATNKKFIITGVVLVLLAVPVAIWQTSDNSSPNVPAAATSTTAKQSEPTTNLSYQGEQGKTALDLLKTKAEVVTKNDPNLGEYVISVNGNDGGGTKYWLYYINDKEAVEGAGTYMTKTGEKIEWKLQ